LSLDGREIADPSPSRASNDYQRDEGAVGSLAARRAGRGGLEVRRLRQWTLATAGVLLACVVAAMNQANSETFKVQLKGLQFSPAAISVHVGDTIEWVNEDFVAHTATARNGA